MKKLLFIVFVTVLGSANIYSQSKAKPRANKVATVNAQKKSPQVKKGTPNSNLSKEEFCKKYLEGYIFSAKIPTAKFFPEATLLYDLHPLMTTVYLGFGNDDDQGKGGAVYVYKTELDLSKVRNNDSRGYLLQQDGLAKEYFTNTKQTPQEFSIENGVITVSEHHFKYDTSKETLYDIDKDFYYTKESVK